MRRIGIVDLMAVTARGTAAAQFSRLITAATGRVEIELLNLDPSAGPPRPADWVTMATCDALIEASSAAFSDGSAAAGHCFAT